MRPAFWSIFWPVLAAILAALLIVGAIGALVTAEIIHKADQSLNTLDEGN
jgi:ABC-type sugar transport system permease subunit